MKITIGKASFATKISATEHVRGLLHKYDLGSPVEPEDHDFLLDLLGRHTEFEEKVGCGVEYFSRGQHPQYKSPCFILHRLDGTSTDFSTVNCINAKGPSLMSEFREACRQAVDKKILARKHEIFDAGDGTVLCPQTGERLGKEDCWLIQLAPSWSEIVNKFIAFRGVQPSEADIQKSDDNQYSPVLVDDELSKAFVAFHAKYMNLVPKKVRR